MKLAIFEWIDFYERKATENLKDCISQESKRRLDAYSAKHDAKQKRTNKLLRTLKSHNDTNN